MQLVVAVHFSVSTSPFTNRRCMTTTTATGGTFAIVRFHFDMASGHKGHALDMHDDGGIPGSVVIRSQFSDTTRYLLCEIRAIGDNAIRPHFQKILHVPLRINKPRKNLKA